jgi:hypothetical protein
MTQRVRLPERPDLRASACDLPDSARRTERRLGERSPSTFPVPQCDVQIGLASDSTS